ncbi:MAG: hypothetical protein MI741_14015 [Rhodospirillales bacterium]|nr:hypothetical protein [Rhodospirillales bacterium]
MTRVNGVWYYRRRVPKHLESAFGKTVIKFSLNTTDFKEAEKLRNLKDVEWDTRFEQAEGKAPAEVSSVLSRHEALKIVQCYVRETDLVGSATVSRCSLNISFGVLK